MAKPSKYGIIDSLMSYDRMLPHFYIKPRIRLAAFITAFTAIAGFFITLNSSSLNNPETCTCNHGYGIDPFEYHLIAVNLAVYHQFPVYGFIGDPKDYNICPENTAARPYLNDLQKAGPVLFTGRPPVFPLLLAFAYSLFGINLQVFIVLCALCSALLVGLMPYTGYRLWGTKGLWTGLIAALLFLAFKNTGSTAINAEYFTKLMAFLLFLCLAIAIKEKKNTAYFTTGIVLAITLLTKGTFIFIPIFLSIGLLTNAVKERNFTPLRNLLLLAAGALLTIAPWSLFINWEVHQQKQSMHAWAQRFAATMPVISVSKASELVVNGVYNPKAIDYFNKSQQVVYTGNAGLILLTNQVDTEILRSVNNEFCLDGDIHPEWKLIQSSLYNSRYAHLSGSSQIFHFYIDNPALGLKILKAKIINCSGEKPVLFLATGALWALYMLLLALNRSNRLSEIPIRILLLLALVTIVFLGFSPVLAAAPLILIAIFLAGACFINQSGAAPWATLAAVFSFNFLLLILVIYGDVRFVANIDAVAVFAFTGLVFRIIQELVFKPNAIPAS